MTQRSISSHDWVLRNAAMTASMKVTSGASACRKQHVISGERSGFMPLALGVDPQPPMFLLRHVLPSCVMLTQSSQTTDGDVSGY